MVYMTSVAALHKDFKEKTPEDDHLVLLRTSSSELVEYGIPRVEEGTRPIGVNDLRYFMFNYDAFPEYVRGDFESLSKGVLIDKNRGSLLNPLQNAFYRIRDKDERKSAQAQVYGYLAGVRGFRGKTNFAFLDNILNTESAKIFRKAVQEAKRMNDPDHAANLFGIDRFEIAFVLSKLRTKQ